MPPSLGSGGGCRFSGNLWKDSSQIEIQALRAEGTRAAIRFPSAGRHSPPGTETRDFLVSGPKKNHRQTKIDGFTRDFAFQTGEIPLPWGLGMIQGCACLSFPLGRSMARPALAICEPDSENATPRIRDAPVSGLYPPPLRRRSPHGPAPPGATLAPHDGPGVFTCGCALYLEGRRKKGRKIRPFHQDIRFLNRQPAAQFPKWSVFFSSPSE